jgi:hypothetical protein
LLSENPIITWEIVRDNPDKPWNWDLLSGNPNITWEIVRDNPVKPWDWNSLSANPNTTWEIVRDNPDKDWNWFALGQNKYGYDNIVEKSKIIKDIMLRKIQFKNTIEKLSLFSRNIDKIINKRLTYN